MLLHTVGTPFGVLEVRVLLEAYAAAQAALGHSKSCGSWEPWIDPVAPKAGQTTKLVAHACIEAGP